MSLRCYQDLIVWQKAMDLVTECYRITRTFPRYETYALSSQLQRAVVSVPANIAEGYARQHRGDYLHHLSIAAGSLAETETHIQIANRLEYLDEVTCELLLAQTGEVSRMLAALRRSLSLPDSQTLNPRP